MRAAMTTPRPPGAARSVVVDPRAMRRAGAALLTASWLATAMACQEEALERLNPQISVCPAVTDTVDTDVDDGAPPRLVPAPAAQCDRGLELGALPVTVEHPVPLFIVNRGSAALLVDAVDSDDGAFVIAAFPPRVERGVGELVDLRLTLPADGLGPRAATLTFSSDDPARGRFAVPLQVTGVERPVPDLVLCVDDVCGPAAVLDFGVVRRTREEGRVVTVRNAGDVALQLTGARLVDQSSLPGEFQLLSSTRPGTLEPGGSAPVALAYEPGDGGRDGARLVFTSDDPDNDEALVDLRGESPQDLPPVAIAVDELSGETAVTARVGDRLALDGTASLDPEGDVLGYAWTLTPPAGGTAPLDDDDATRAAFTPDRAGTWRAALVVTDSLGQSSLAAVVLYDVRPRFRFRAELSWSTRQDLDLHLVDLALPDGTSGALLQAGDCGGEVRRLELDDATDALDDCVLVDDAAAGPATETLVIEQPAAGTYAVWVHAFADGGLPDAVATVALRLDDGEPVQRLTQTLPATCAAWHVADVTFPQGTFTNLGDAVVEVCP
jgi:hypothetical protein